MFRWARLTYSSPVTVRWIYVLGTDEESQIKMKYDKVPTLSWSGWNSWTSWTGINPLPICQMKKNLIKSKKELAKF